ncbi:YlxR family protein [Corynebacterium kalidii]|uniref:YlxR family protein n=1 Tax=Corynebacterium kalidii TaxID=2931982 RepID=A0A9X2B059_9CORY|nr:YlxR family protein [Corynebacterium kalidii]MCJ7859513.1 YlxR family protein [Corynebacterium kalidii]
MSVRPPRPSPDAGPLRTCIATRGVHPASALLRCVAEWTYEGGGPGSVRVVPDPRRRLPGRGAWITATVSAYETAVQRRAFARALKVPSEADTTPVLEYLRDRGDSRGSGVSTSREVPHLTTSPVAEKVKETDY